MCRWRVNSSRGTRHSVPLANRLVMRARYSVLLTSILVICIDVVKYQLRKTRLIWSAAILFFEKYDKYDSLARIFKLWDMKKNKNIYKWNKNLRFLLLETISKYSSNFILTFYNISWCSLGIVGYFKSREQYTMQAYHHILHTGILFLDGSDSESRLRILGWDFFSFHWH